MLRTRKNLLAAVAIGLTAVIGASSAAAGSPRRQPAAATKSPTAGCSWLARSDDDTVNVAYPDTSATYWLTHFNLAAGEKLRIHGTYPAARYFSFHTYTASGLIEDSRYDAQIHARRGGNPFRRPVSAGRHHYVLTVRAGAVPKHRAPNTVYTGTVPKTGAPNLDGLLIYRVYTPTDPTSAQGGVALPSIALRESGRTVTKMGGCATDQPSTNGAIDRIYNSLGYPKSGPPIPVPNATKRPTWARTSSNLKVAGLFGNQQNAYLTARTSLQYGQILVIRAKAPTFPDTTRGVPVYRPSQVRYWSMCQNSSTTRVVACVPDSRAPLRHRHYTIVVSTAASRPTDANRRHGVAWIPWGAQPDGVLIYRNMVAAPGFAQATQKVATGANPKKIMGSYFPLAHYCSTASYNTKGARHCS